MFFYSFGSLVFYYYTKKDTKYIFYFEHTTYYFWDNLLMYFFNGFAFDYIPSTVRRFRIRMKFKDLLNFSKATTTQKRLAKNNISVSLPLMFP